MSTSASGSRLGRGLAALLGEEAGPARFGMQTLSVAQIEPGPFQPRKLIDEAQLNELAASIGSQGLLQPILVRPHPSAPRRYQIIAGERRWRASQIASLGEIPTLVCNLSDADAMAAALIENLQRQDLNPIEEAEGYARLLREFGLTQDRLGQAVGKSRSHVANALRLLQLPPPLRTAVETGGLTAGHARALLTHPDPETAARTVIARGLNVRQTEQLGDRKKNPSQPRKHVDRDMTEISRKISSHLGLRVGIEGTAEKGALKLEYEDFDQFEGIVSLLMGGNLH